MVNALEKLKIAISVANQDKSLMIEINSTYLKRMRACRGQKLVLEYVNGVNYKFCGYPAIETDTVKHFEIIET